MPLSYQQFKKIIYTHYKQNPRLFPWRKTTDPYHILVSEIMLQQTQADRVVEKYGQFLAAFPTTRDLAEASLRQVMQKWQGLGYNRRGMHLHRAAKMVVKDWHGAIPKEARKLEQLPGVGPYTARAILAFAFNMPVVFIETNIRSVYLHFFFKNKTGVHDRDILKRIEKSLDAKHPCRWYQALMDYGALLKATRPNPGRRSAHHTRQSKFTGSDREIRGAIIRELIKKSATERSLAQTLNFSKKRVEKNLAALTKEGLVKKQKGIFAIA